MALEFVLFTTTQRRQQLICRGQVRGVGGVGHGPIEVVSDAAILKDRRNSPGEEETFAKLKGKLGD